MHTFTLRSHRDHWPSDSHLGEALPACSPRPLPAFRAFTDRMKFVIGASKLGRQSSIKTCEPKTTFSHDTRLKVMISDDSSAKLRTPPIVM